MDCWSNYSPRSRARRVTPKWDGSRNFSERWKPEKVLDCHEGGGLWMDAEGPCVSFFLLFFLFHDGFRTRKRLAYTIFSPFFLGQSKRGVTLPLPWRFRFRRIRDETRRCNAKYDSLRQTQDLTPFSQRRTTLRPCPRSSAAPLAPSSQTRASP